MRLLTTYLCILSVLGWAGQCCVFRAMHLLFIAITLIIFAGFFGVLNICLGVVFENKSLKKSLLLAQNSVTELEDRVAGIRLFKALIHNFTRYNYINSRMSVKLERLLLCNLFQRMPLACLTLVLFQCITTTHHDSGLCRKFYGYFFLEPNVL